MTLCTNILLRTEHSQREVYDRMNQLLGAPEKPVGWEKMSNAPGQGFAAWLITAGPSSPGEHDDDCEPECAYWRCVHPGWDVLVNLDTGYAYRDSYGGCSILHARLIVDLYHWIVATGGSLTWINEFSGVMNEGLSGIEEFLGNGDEAQEWFSSLVLPEFLGNL